MPILFSLRYRSLIAGLAFLLAPSFLFLFFLFFCIIFFIRCVFRVSLLLSFFLPGSSSDEPPARLNLLVSRGEGFTPCTLASFRDG